MSNETNICPGCESGSYQSIQSECEDLLHGFRGTWSLFECDVCHLIYTTPRLSKDEILNYYPKDYVPYRHGVGLRESFIGSGLRKVVMSPYWLRYGDPEWSIAPFGQGRLLEIGCGSGMFLKKMSTLGWKCTGIDISSLAVEQTKKNISSTSVFQSTLADFRTEQRYDLIILSHVLEHLPEPVESLQKCFNLLSPGGQIFIGIPNIDSLEARLFGKYWIGLDVPRHITHFSETVVRRQLENCGFQILNIRPAMFASSLSESLIFMLPKWARERVLHSSLSRLLYLLAIFPAALSNLFGNRGIIEIIAKRPN